MICFHCKKPIKRRKGRTYMIYRTREAGPLHFRNWHITCATDEVVDAEYPKSYKSAAFAVEKEESWATLGGRSWRNH